MSVLEPNVGKRDKSIRLILSALFIYLGYKYTWYSYIIAIILIITVVTSQCPLYSILKINTKKE